MDMDGLLMGPRRSREAVALGGEVAEPRAERQDEIALGEGGELRLAVADAEIAGIERMIVSEEIMAAEADRDRHGEPLGKVAQVLPSLAGRQLAASDDQRPFGDAEKLDGLRDRCLVGCRHRAG